MRLKGDRHSADPPFSTVLAVAEEEPAPYKHAGPPRPVIEGLLAKDPTDRPGANETRLALLEVQRELEQGAGFQEREGRQRSGPELRDRSLLELV